MAVGQPVGAWEEAAPSHLPSAVAASPPANSTDVHEAPSHTTG